MKKFLPIKQEKFIPDTLLFSDLHLDERKEFDFIDSTTGLNSRFLEGLSILDQIIEYLKNNRNIQYTKFLGDWFKLKDKVPNHMLIELKNRLNQIQELTEFTILMGNHDYALPNYPLINVLENSKNPFQTLIIKPEVLYDINKVCYGYIPFQRDMKEFWQIWNSLHQEYPINIMLFHQEMPGARFNDCKVIPGIVPDSYFNPDILYLSGHLHIHQKSKFVNWIGSPYQVNFADEGISKFIWLLEAITKKIKYLQLSYPEFISIDINDFINEALSDDFIKLTTKGNYIRLTGEMDFSSWTSEYKKQIKSYFQDIGAKGVSFQVKSIKSKQDPSLVIQNIEDDETIIRSFANNIKENLDEEKLIQVGLEVFYQN